jgi:hypothetical protein
MKQEILSEVNRIHEIMGILNENKEIIFEAGGPGPKNQIVTKFFEILGLAAEKDLDKNWQVLQQKVSSGAASQEEREAETIIKDFLRSKPDIGALNSKRFSLAVDKYGDDLLEAFYKQEEVREALLKAFEKANPAFEKVKNSLSRPVKFDKMYKMSDLEKWKKSATLSIDGMASVPNYLKPELQEQLEKNFEELSVELSEKNAQRIANAEAQLVDLESYFGSVNSVQKVLNLTKEESTEFYKKFKQIDELIKSSKNTIDSEEFLTRINNLKQAASEISPSDLKIIQSKFKGAKWPSWLKSKDGTLSYLKLGIFVFAVCGVGGYFTGLPLCDKIGYAVGVVIRKTFDGGKQGMSGGAEGFKSSGDNTGSQNQQGDGQNSNQTSNGQTKDTIKTWLTADANGEHGTNKWDINTLGDIIYDASATPNKAIVIVNNKQWPMTYSNNTWNWD